MSTIGTGTPLQLLPILMDERGKTFLLALDAFNLLSLELIQNQNCFVEQSPVLESAFLKRRQLCIDIQSSALRNSDSLAALLQTYEIETLPAEFPIAILWDEAPIASSIFEIMVKLTGEVKIALPEEAFGLRLVSLTLSKGTIAVSVTPGAAGKANVSVEDSSIAMNPEELIRFASEWEIKPELAFFAKAGPFLLPPFSEETLADIDARVKDTENAQLEAPVPSIVLENAEEEGIDEQDTAVPQEENGKDRWQCNQCGAFNQQYTQVCTSCGASTLDVGEEMPVTREPVPVQQPDIREYVPEQRPKRKEPIRDDSRTTTKWKCPHCTFENREGDKICSQCNKTSTPPEVPEVKKEGWTCEYCTLVNIDSARICDACAKTRKDLLPPSPPPEEAEVVTTGYWKCGNCEYPANGPTDIRCYKCKAVKGTPREVKTAGIEDGWMCPVCETENYSFSRACRRCEAPKSTERADKEEQRYEEGKFENGRAALKPGAKAAEPKAGNTWKCERCNIDVESSRGYCGKCYELKPTSGLGRELPSPPKTTPSQEEWKCPICQHVNRRERTCLVCNQPKPGTEEEKTDQSWICKCGKRNLEHRTRCISCYQKKPLDQPTAAQYENWTCAECKNSNIYYDAKCRKCGTSKEFKPKVPDTDPNEEDMELNLRADPVVYPSAARTDIRNKGTDLESTAPRPTQALDIDMRGKDRPSAVLASRPVDRGNTADRGTAHDQRWKVEMGEAADKDFGIETRVSADKSRVETKPSYWNCSACHTVNPNLDSICYQCRNPKSEASPPAKVPEQKPRTFYWTCKGCSKENYKDDIKCYSCKLPKGQELVEEEKWTCRHCQAKNVERETYCTKCFEDRQERQAVGNQQASRGSKLDPGWTCAYCHSANVSTSIRCSNCHRTAPRKGPLNPEPRAKTCTSCGHLTTQGSSLCSMCARGVTYNSPKSWMCQRCRIAVTGANCSRCHSSKPRP